MQKPPYRFCWWCSKQLYNNRHRVMEVIGGLVYVHITCADDMEKSGDGWKAGN